MVSHDSISTTSPRITSEKNRGLVGSSVNTDVVVDCTSDPVWEPIVIREIRLSGVTFLLKKKAQDLQLELEVLNLTFPRGKSLKIFSALRLSDNNDLVPN